jgi:hypothetical protein
MIRIKIFVKFKHEDFIGYEIEFLDLSEDGENGANIIVSERD